MGKRAGNTDTEKYTSGGRYAHKTSEYGMLMDALMSRGFDEGGSGELLDSENNCLYIGGLYADDLPYVSLYAYDLAPDA